MGIKKGQTRTFSLWSQLVAMIYSHLAHCLSLNDVCDSLSLHAAALNSIRNATAPKRNTLAHANKTRSAEFVKKLFWTLLEALQEQSPGFFEGKGKRTYTKLPRRFKRTVAAVDSTTISLVLNSIDWAKHRKKKAAAKMHMALNLQNMLPIRVITDKAKDADAKRMHDCCSAIGSGDIAVFDKAYVALSELLDLTDRGAFWVTRAKDNMKYAIVRNLKIGNQKNIHWDAEVRWTGKKSNKLYGGKTVRLVCATVMVKNKPKYMVFMTNNMEWAASSICDLYQSRWAIETFFKEIKQTLKLSDFLGYSQNAVEWQIWTGLITYVLLRYAMYLSEWKEGFKRVFTLVRGAMWVKIDLIELLVKYGTARGKKMKIPIMTGNYIDWLPGIDWSTA